MTSIRLIRCWLPSTLAAVLSALFVGCQRSNSDSGNGLAYDCGPVFAADAIPLVHTFKVPNTKNQILTIKKLIQSCNCTDAKLSTMAIAPGSSADLKLTIKPSPALGSWKVQCTLETDDPEQPDKTYTVTYRSYPQVRFDTNSINLGVSTRGAAGEPPPTNKAEAWFEVFERSSNHVDGFGIAAAPSPLTVNVDRDPVIDRYEGGKITRSRYRLVVSFDPKSSESESASGIHSATVSARSRLGQATSVAVIWTLDRPLQVSPDPVSFGIVKGVGGTASKKVILTALDKKPFRLLAFDSDTDGVNAAGEGEQGAAATPGLMHIVSLGYEAKKSGKSYPSGRVRITTDHPRMPTVTIPWSAILRD